MDAMPVPPELRQAAQWVVWKYEERQGKRTKVPYSVATGERASTTDAKSWTVYEAAEACGRQPGVDGIGFVFSATDEFVGVDLDDCRDVESGLVAPWAMEIVTLLNSYTEITPSGRGLHVLCRGKLPPGGRRKGSVEIYEQGRYFTITGAALPEAPLRLEPRTEALAELHRRIFPPQATNAPPATSTPKPNGAAGAAPDPWAIVERVLQHPKEAALWRGSIAGYPSQSEAEMALVGLIAFYAGPDPPLIDRIFRMSDLSRDKWDSPRPEGTYGSMTIARALAGKSEYFEWTAAARKGTSVPLVVTESVVKTAETPLELPPEAYHGLPGQVMRTIAPHTESHPAGILCSFLTGGGCLIGSRPHIFRDGQRHGCNEFGLLMGKSGVGRKGTSSRRVEEIFKFTGPISSTTYCDKTKIDDIHEEQPRFVDDLGWSDIVLRGLGSGEALVAALAEENQSGIVDPRRMVFEPEFARCLKVMQREGSTLSDMLKGAWDSEPMHVRTKSGVLRADTSHVSILAHVTEPDLRERLGNAELFNGFANRFLWFNTGRVRSLPFGGGQVPLGPLVYRVHQALAHAAAWLGAMEFDQDACRIWGEIDAEGFGGVYDLCCKTPPGLLGAVTDRGAAHVTRIALQYAIWDQAKSVSVRHLLAGLGVWDYSFRTCISLFGRSTGDAAADLILEKLVEVHPGFLTRKEIRDLFARNATPGRIPRALELLEELGMIARQKMDTGGHPAEIVLLLKANPYDQRDQSPLEVARKQAKLLGYTTEATEAGGRTGEDYSH